MSVVAPFNASEFRSVANSLRGPAQNNYYEMRFILDGSKGNVMRKELTKRGFDVDDMTFRIHLTDLPGRVMESISRMYAGPQRQVPLGHVYSTLQIQAVEYGDRKSRGFFDAWQDIMMERSAGWNIKYADEICMSCELSLYNRSSVGTDNPASPNKLMGTEINSSFASSAVKKLAPVFDAYLPASPAAKPATATAAAKYKFLKVFPMSIGASQLSWDNKDQIMSIPIELSYHSWENRYITVEGKPRLISVGSAKGGDDSFLGRLKQIHAEYNKIVKTVNQVKQFINNTKATFNNARIILNDIRNFKPKFGSISDAAETFSRASNIGNRIIGTGEQAKSTFVKPTPIFSSTRITTKVFGV